MRSHYLGIIFLFVLGNFSAQEGKTSLKPSSILVGQLAKLVYSIELPANSAYKHLPFGNIVPSIKKNDQGYTTTDLSSDIEQIGVMHDTVILRGKKKELRITYTISGWNEGTYLINGARLQLNDSMIVFPEVALKVALVPEKKGQEIYDIRESFSDLPEAPNPAIVFFEKNRSWLIPLLIVLSGGLLLFFLWWRNRPKKSDFVPELSLKERSLLAIDALEKERLWEKGKLKEHYIELSYILRSYLSARYTLSMLENTTSEAQLLLRQIGLHEETIRTIGKVLDQSDMVKFAKSAPEETEVLKISQLVRQIIAETSPLEFEKHE